MMKKNCDCHYCKQNINEYFCIKCGYNFNECEVKNFNWHDISLCPKCHPKAINLDELYKIFYNSNHENQTSD